MKKMIRALTYGLIINSTYLHTGNASVPIPEKKPEVPVKALQKQNNSPSGNNNSSSATKTSPGVDLLVFGKNYVQKVESERSGRRRKNEPPPQMVQGPYLKVSDVFRSALENDTRLKASEQTVIASVYRLKGDRAQAYGPSATISGGVSYVDNQTSMPNSSFPSSSFSGNSSGVTPQWSLNLIQPLYYPSQIIQKEKSELNITVTETQNAIVAQDLILRVAQNYLDIINIEESLQVKESEIVANQRHLDNVKLQFEVGLVTGADVATAEAQLYNIKIDKENLLQALASAQETLYQTWKVEPNKVMKKLKENLQFLNPEPNKPEAWIEQARTANLFVAYSELLVGLAAKDVELAQSAVRTFNVDAVFSHSEVYSLLGSSHSVNTKSNNIGLRVNMKFFDSGLARNRASEANAFKTEKKLNADTARNEAAIECRNAYAGVVNGANKIRLSQKSVEASSRALRGIIEQYEQGLRLNFEALQAISRLNNNKLELLQAKFDYIMSRLKLKKAVGTLTAADLEEVDSYFENPKIEQQ